MEESVREIFSLPEKDPGQYPPLVLAFIGDAVCELVIRNVVAAGGEKSPRKMHDESAAFARAGAQAAMARSVADMLTEEEAEVLRRGRNAHPATIAKNASVSEYRQATGWEAMIGWLYLTGRKERLTELIREGMKAV